MWKGQRWKRNWSSSGWFWDVGIYTMWHQGRPGLEVIHKNKHTLGEYYICLHYSTKRNKPNKAKRNQSKHNPIIKTKRNIETDLAILHARSIVFERGLHPKNLGNEIPTPQNKNYQNYQKSYPVCVCVCLCWGGGGLLLHISQFLDLPPTLFSNV